LVFGWDCVDGTFEYEYFDNQSNVDGATTLHVTKGATITASMTLGLGGSVSGTVRSDTGMTLSGIDVLAIDAAGLQVAFDTTDTNGVYTLSGLRPGAAHKILFVDPAGVYQDEFYDTRYSFETAADVYVTAGGTTNSINAVLLPLGFGSDEPAIGLVDPTQGQWHLRNRDGLVKTFFFGNPGDFPIMGDWNCDGIDTPGMYRQSDGFVYLRNDNTQGIADIRFFFGDPGDVPLAGDFNGDGCDTVSIYRPSEGRFFIIDKLGENEGGLGAAETSYLFGNLGDKPFVGDFNGNGVTTAGLHRESTGLVYFRQTHTQGTADTQFIFGDPQDRLVAGDWNDNGTDSPALFRPSNVTMYFRYTNSQGNADTWFVFGQPGWLPVAGDFD
jgi:hypothetical protein